LGWDASGLGTIAQNTTYKFAGKGCLGVTTPATGGAIQRAWKTIPVPRASSRIGVEMHMACQTDTENFDFFNVGIRFNSVDAGVLDWYFFNVYRSGGAQLVTTFGGAGEVMPEFPANYDGTVFTTTVDWHYLKFIVDLTKREYVSIEIDKIFKSLVGHSAAKVGSPTKYNSLIIQLAGYNGPAATACLTLFDEVLVTSNEP
jgi:hypothetical protein